MAEITDEDIMLADLSDDEVKAIRESEDEPGETDETDDQPEPEEAQDGEPEQKPEESAKPEEQAEEQPVQQPGFNLKTETSAEDVQSRIVELKQKFDDGEVEFDEFLSQRDALKMQLAKAEMYEDINKQFRQNQWETAKKSFVDDNPELMGVSSRAAGYVSILTGLLQSEQGQKMTDAEILDAAKAKFYEENPQLLPQGGADAKPRATSDPRSNVRQLADAQAKRRVQTLANLPAASENDTGSSEFSYLDNLNGEKFEKAVEKMTDEQRERYLEAG